MDRLHDKKILLRYKQGRKFYYRSAYSNDEVIMNALNEMANRYCNGTLQKLSKIINIMLNDKELISA